MIRSPSDEKYTSDVNIIESGAVLQLNDCKYCRLWQSGTVRDPYRPYGLHSVLMSRLGNIDIIGVGGQ